jgi:hypothetical protein
MTEREQQNQPALSISLSEVSTELGFCRSWIDQKGANHYLASIPGQRTRLEAFYDAYRTTATGTLAGLLILFERSRNLPSDIQFFAGLIEAQLQRGGALVMIDHRDNYLEGEEDVGAHYALINVTHLNRGEHRFQRNAWKIIPLPIFTRLLGRGMIFDEEGYPQPDKEEWGLVEVFEFLNRLFPQRVCLADGTFHRLDASIGNTGILPPLSSYHKKHGILFLDPLCQRGLSPEAATSFVSAYQDPDELLVVQGGQIQRVNLRTETEKPLTDGQIVGSLKNGNSTWLPGLVHPRAPAHGLYETLDPTYSVLARGIITARQK